MATARGRSRAPDSPTAGLPDGPLDRDGPLATALDGLTDEGRRPLVTGTARSLLLTVLGEFVRPGGGPVWTSALLHVLGGLGIEQQTARQAIARAASAGWLTGERFGREVRWALTDTVRSAIEELDGRAESMSAVPPVWDGNCLIVFVTIPNDRRDARKRLYSALGWAGFGNPMPGLWASPHTDRAEEVASVIRDLGLRDSTIAFVGTTMSAGLSDAEIVRRAWDLDGVAERYERVIARFDGLHPEAGDDVVLSYVALVHEWQQSPYLDPQLPADLLPEWIGRRATEMFCRLRREWSDAAHARWRELDASGPSGS
ncbi:MAG TPA: PaaX family transcriptional regulator C-terminal domain-containing protein [Pseudonocardia sp.]|jgi:phenylacetic acid degradation operon negative regulatory protein